MMSKYFRKVVLIGLITMSDLSYADDVQEKDKLNNEYKNISEMVDDVNKKFNTCQLMSSVDLEIFNIKAGLRDSDLKLPKQECIENSKVIIKNGYKKLAPQLKKKKNQEKEFKEYILTAIASFDGLEIRSTDRTTIYNQRTNDLKDELLKAGNSILIDLD